SDLVKIGDGVGFNADRTTEATLKANYPYMRTVEYVDGANAPSGTLYKPQAAAWYVFDVAGNRAYTEQALASLTMEDGVPATTFGVTTFTVELSGSTLSARARGNTGNWANPYAVVHFYLVDGDGIIQYVGSDTGATLGDDGGIRTYTWQVTYNPANFKSPVKDRFAIAVTSAG